MTLTSIIGMTSRPCRDIPSNMCCCLRNLRLHPAALGSLTSLHQAVSDAVCQPLPREDTLNWPQELGGHVGVLYLSVRTTVGESCSRTSSSIVTHFVTSSQLAALFRPLTR